MLAFRYDSVGKNIRVQNKTMNSYWDIVVLGQKFPIVVVMTGIAKLIEVTSYRRGSVGYSKDNAKIRLSHSAYNSIKNSVSYGV